LFGLKSVSANQAGESLQFNFEVELRILYQAVAVISINPDDNSRYN